MEDAVIQGFICPFCMEDFGDFSRLQQHVEVDHPEEEDVDLAESVVQNVKGLFDRAKRGIKKLDAKINISEISSQVNIPTVPSDLAEKIVEKAAIPIPKAPKPLPPDEVPLGVTRSHTSEFRKYRDSSIDETTTRTNMLIIRLDRLIHAGPMDPKKRREYERGIVPWLDDSDVVCCPFCAARFGLTKRRHHCRLCGKVMCHTCSQFLSFLSAKKLTNPAIAHEMLEAAANSSTLSSMQPSEDSLSPTSSKRKLFSLTQQSMDKMKNLLGGAMTKVQTAAVNAAGDEFSVSSLIQQDDSECMRVCGSCLNHLQRRENMMDQGKPPALVEQYAFLRQSMAEIKQLVPTYARIANSIQNGETMYTLKTAEDMRQKCLEKQRSIDVLSKTIATGADDDVNAFKEQQLRKNIRATTLKVLEGLIGQTSSLPTAEEYEQLVQRHKEQVAKQVAAAREKADRMMKVSSSMPSISSSQQQGSTNSLQGLNTARSPLPSTSSYTDPNVVDDGWTPQQSKSHNPFLEEEGVSHPLIEQRDILRSYLQQAASAGRMADVDILEQNLNLIEEEMRNVGINP